MNKKTYKPLSDLQRKAIEALQHVRPRSGEKPTIRQMGKWERISEDGETRLWKMYHRYRRQLPPLPDEHVSERPGMSVAAQVARIHRAGYLTRKEVGK